MPYVDDHILTPRDVYNAKFWRRRARLTLVAAESVDDPQLKTHLAQVAAEYRKLARYADAIKAETKTRRPSVSAPGAGDGFNPRNCA